MNCPHLRSDGELARNNLVKRAAGRNHHGNDWAIDFRWKSHKSGSREPKMGRTVRRSSVVLSLIAREAERRNSKWKTQICQNRSRRPAKPQTMFTKALR